MSPSLPTVHVLRGPRKVIAERRAEPRWCFGERKRLPGTFLFLDYEDDEPGAGWYEPIWVYRCDGCGRDSREFGSSRF